ncbi:hypothetical protein LINPERPRIM_LOCUS7874 [Linum perenne]
MREKSRERGKQIWRGFERGFRGSGLGARSEDRSLRALEIRGRKVEISVSNRFANAGFRISVSSSGVSHFIFLDITLMQWLGKVMQLAMENGWKFGRGLVKRSGARALQIGTFEWKNVCFLRILEICDIGKRFFVAIPADEDKEGWGSWLKTIQSVLLGEKRIDGLLSLGGRSFVDVLSRKNEVVKGKELEEFQKVGVGISVGEEAVDSSIIEVDEEGVVKRMAKLKSWVVVYFNLGPKDFVVWEEFRKWMKRWWGVDLEWTSKRLGDESWLVEFESEAKVESIVQRKEWFFRGVRVEVRRWCPEAGRLRRVEL